jgi:hypothetical protein
MKIHANKDDDYDHLICQYNIWLVNSVIEFSQIILFLFHTLKLNKTVTMKIELEKEKYGITDKYFKDFKQKLKNL